MAEDLIICFCYKYVIQESFVGLLCRNPTRLLRRLRFHPPSLQAYLRLQPWLALVLHRGILV
jgi:hypothetical protein